MTVLRFFAPPPPLQYVILTLVHRLSGASMMHCFSPLVVAQTVVEC